MNFYPENLIKFSKKLKAPGDNWIAPKIPHDKLSICEHQWTAVIRIAVREVDFYAHMI